MQSFPTDLQYENSVKRTLYQHLLSDAFLTLDAFINTYTC